MKIFLLALLLSAGNLKNAPLTIAAAASISSSGLPVGQQIAALAIFVVIASLGLLAPLVVYLVMRERRGARWATGRSGPRGTTRLSWPSCSSCSG